MPQKYWSGDLEVRLYLFSFRLVSTRFRLNPALRSADLVSRLIKIFQVILSTSNKRFLLKFKRLEMLEKYLKEDLVCKQFSVSLMAPLPPIKNNL